MAKFGLQMAPQFGYDYKTINQITLHAEKAGYDAIWFGDHFFLDNSSEDRNCMDTWTLLASLASITKKIRLGTLVACQSYRYPAVLAKIAATIDMISNGRLYFGIGAGWKEMEYNAYGIPFPSLKDRMDQLEEAIQIITFLWTEPKVSFQGKHYKIKNAFSAPKPVQKPRPPIVIGGDGEKRTLKMVAKYADYCNLMLIPDLNQKLKILEKHCIDVGREYQNVGKSICAGGLVGGIFVTDSEDELNAYINAVAIRSKKSVEDVKKRFSAHAPGRWVGYPEDIIERIQYLIDLGFDYFHIRLPWFHGKSIKISQNFANLVMNKIQ
ncbi:MAG: TIGR03560 family F420-dependent LLM class oxidoreductase [Candidatus Hodarchaeales archaeon]|jgi:F420-dependent oxidoreductase-like protein